MKDIIEFTRLQIAKLVKEERPEGISRIETTRSMEALVDAKFGNEVRKYRWYAIDSGLGHMYVAADIDGRRISLQRFVTFLNSENKSLDDIKYVSFKNKINFDCRSANLEYRIGRQSMMRNRKPKKNTSSEYKGVRRYEKPNGIVAWKGQIHDGLSSISLGVFDSEKWAASVYDAAAYYLFNGAGYYNFPTDCPNVDALEYAIFRIKGFRARKARRDTDKS